MAFRSDVTVCYSISPRLIIVDAPSTNITIQDLHDTVQEIDQRQENLNRANLIQTSGGADLGGGSFTGLTSTLQNAQLAFERRVNLLETGTITTASTPGKFVSVIDSAALFQTNLVQRGDLVVNKADASHAEVIEVVSETELKVISPTGGAEDDYDVGEAYEVWEVVECTIDGGNLVAVDDVGSPITPVFPTFGVFVSRILSTSAGLTVGAPADFVSALRTEVFDGQTFEDLLTYLKSWGYGRFVETSTNVFDYYDHAGATVLFTLTLTEAGGLVSRARS